MDAIAFLCGSLFLTLVSGQTCPTPQPPKDGYIKAMAYMQEDVVEAVFFACNAGYKLTGVNYARCESSQWLNAVPSCQACPAGNWGEGCQYKCNCAHGSCNNVNGRCYCNPGWTGYDCSADVNECEVNCGRDACGTLSCSNTMGSYICLDSCRPLTIKQDYSDDIALICDNVLNVNDPKGHICSLVCTETNAELTPTHMTVIHCSDSTNYKWTTLDGPFEKPTCEVKQSNREVLPGAETTTNCWMILTSSCWGMQAVSSDSVVDVSISLLKNSSSRQGRKLAFVQRDA